MPTSPNNIPNQAAPNHRPRFAFAMRFEFDYRFFAPPTLSAAVGEPQHWPFHPLYLKTQRNRGERAAFAPSAKARVWTRQRTGATRRVATMIVLALIASASAISARMTRGHHSVATQRTNEGAPANRHHILASAEALRNLTIRFACHAQRRV